MGKKGKPAKPEGLVQEFIFKHPWFTFAIAASAAAAAFYFLLYHPDESEEGEEED
jgi:hypothetical protein